MTNLKKTLAVVLAFAMILSMGAVSTFAAYSDVESGTLVSEAVDVLSSLEILTGFEDGTFRPTETVTRAQMAAIICRMLGYEDQAQSSKGTTVFNDVAGDHWAAGYVNVAQAQGIINGYGDGNFGPEDKVTYEQAVKMIVSALGYDLAANAKGGYPTGYLAIASAEGITKSANGRVGDAAARSTIAVLAYNALEVRLMDQTVWTTNQEDEYAKTNKTILSQYLDVEKWEGVVTDSSMTAIAKYGYKSDSLPQATVNGSEYGWSGGSYIKLRTTSVTADARLINADEYIGKMVVAYVGEDEDPETGKKMIYAMAEKKAANEIISFSTTQLADDDADYATADKVVYRRPGSNFVEEIDLAGASTTVLRNFYPVGSVNSASTIASAAPNGGTVTLISNDFDNDIEYVLITAYDGNEAAIEEVTVDDTRYSFDTYTGMIKDIDTDKQDKLNIVYIDGKLATVADLAAEMTVSVANIYNNNTQILYASTATVTGVVDAYDNEGAVTIANEEYELSTVYANGNAALAAQNLMNEEGVFYLNVDGEIAWNETDPTGNVKYGMVLAVSYESGIKDAYYAQVVTADGTVAEYEIADKAKYNANATDAAVADAIADIIEGANFTVNASNVAKLIYSEAANAIFDITIKNNKITKIEDLVSSTAATGKKYAEDTMTLGAVEMDENTVVFGLEKAASSNAAVDVLEDEVKVGSVSEFFVDGETYAESVTPYEIKRGIAGAVVGSALAAAIADDSAVIVVTSVKNVTYDDDNAVEVIGVQAGEEVSFKLYDKDSTIGGDVDKGDIIMIGALDADNVTKEYKVLVNVNGDPTTATINYANLAALQNGTDGIYNGFGVLDNTATTNSQFEILANVGLSNGTNAINSALFAASTPIAMSTKARYTLVDYTESTKNPEVSLVKGNKSLFSTNTDYTSYVFIRTNDDALTDVVVFRVNAVLAAGTLTVTTPETADSAADGVMTATPGAGASITAYEVNGASVTAAALSALKKGDVVKVTFSKTGFADNTVTATMTGSY